MKIVKGLLFLLLGLLIILGIGTIFLPEKAYVERTAQINAPASVVFEQVNNFKNWEKWSPWKKADPTMKFTYSSNNPTGKGEWYSWTSDGGDGKMTMVESSQNQSLKTQLDFEGMGTSYGSWKFEPSGNGTKVTWGFDAELSGLSKWMGLTMDGFLGGMFEDGLADIKKIAEAAPKPAPAASVLPTPAAEAQ